MEAPPVQYVRTSDGYDIAYTTAGQGQTMVVMPYPFSHARLSWTAPGLCETNVQLARRFRVVHFDARGQGLSSRGLHQSLSVEDYVRDIEAVVQALNLDRFLLFAAVSWKSAIAYASKNSQQVEAVILLDPLGAAAASDQPHRLASQARDDWDTFLMMVGSAFSPAPADTSSRLLLKEQMKECVRQTDYLRMLDALQACDAKEWLTTVDVPTLVLSPRSPWGGSSASEIAASIRRASLLFPDDVGNMLYSPTDEAPHAVSAIEEFVAALTALGAALPDQTLSSREVEVLRLLAAGKSNQQIADELVISLNTVRRHVSNIFDKTGAANRAQAAVYARDHGLA